jgi:hypothetical protein
VRGGARGRGGGGFPGSPASAQSHDTTIQGTDTDASVSRLSAVDLGYLEDPFARFFVQNAGVGPPTRRLPIINRGETFLICPNNISSRRAPPRDALCCLDDPAVPPVFTRSEC